MRRLPATVTSLPERVTGISSVAAAHETDIAVGDVSWPGLALVAIYLLKSYSSVRLNLVKQAAKPILKPVLSDSWVSAI